MNTFLFHPDADKPDFVKSNHLITSLSIVKNDRHWRITIFNRGNSAGNLTVNAEDGPAFVRRLFPEGIEEHPTPAKDVPVMPHLYLLSVNERQMMTIAGCLHMVDFICRDDDCPDEIIDQLAHFTSYQAGFGLMTGYFGPEAMATSAEPRENISERVTYNLIEMRALLKPHMEAIVQLRRSTGRTTLPFEG